jgi:hypothetical protein
VWKHAVDSSYDPLTEAEAHRLKAAGVELYIQALSALPPTGLEQPASRVTSLRNATYAGLKIAGYALLTGNRTPRIDMDFARSGVPDDLWDQLEFCAVDVEVGGIRYNDVLHALARMTMLLHSKPPVVYTNYATWVDKMGNPVPATTPISLLWDASWGIPPGTYKRPYGGWTEADMLLHQYTGGTYVEGQFVDNNVWLVADAPKPPEAQTQLDRIEAKLDELLRRK